MKKKGFKTDGLIGIFFLGCAFFSYPILTVFNVKKMLFGFPLLYLYVFSVWFVIIILIYSFARRQEKSKILESSESFVVPRSTD